MPETARLTLADLDAIAYTQGPGLGAARCWSARRWPTAWPLA